jgi:retinol dehydrogenase-14
MVSHISRGAIGPTVARPRQSSVFRATERGVHLFACNILNTYPAEWSLHGRRCLVTGATAGIGKHGAIALAHLGAEVVIVGRNSRRTATTVDEIRRIVRGAEVSGLVADLSSQSSVRDLARHVRERFSRIHVLVNNAGVFTRRRQQTVDGLELQFAVNHLAPFLLTHLLLDHLAASAPARVVNVASQVERTGVIDFEDLQGARSYDGQRAYRQAKLANILFTGELARRVARRGIVPISVHPGVYTTRLLDDLMGWSRLMTRFGNRGLPSPDAAGPVLARAAAAPELAERPGVHLHEQEIREPSSKARDVATAERLWTESERLTGIDP